MAKFKAKGAVLYFGSANPPTEQVTQIGDIEFDTGERDALLDVTTHDTSGSTREMIDPGWKSPPKVSFEIVVDPANAVHDDLRACEETYAARYAKLVLPDTGSAQWIFACRVASFQIGAPVNGRLSARVTLEGLSANAFTA